MKYYEVENLVNIMSSLADKKFPRKVQLALVRNIQILEPIIETFNKERQKIAQEYAKKDENGMLVFENDRITFETNDDFKAFNDAIDEIANFEEPIELIKFDSSMLEMCEENDKFDVLTVKEEVALSAIINYEED